MFFVLPKDEIPIIWRSRATSGSGSVSISISFFSFGAEEEEEDSVGAVVVVVDDELGGGALLDLLEGGFVPLGAAEEEEGLGALDAAAEEPAGVEFEWETVGWEGDGA